MQSEVELRKMIRTNKPNLPEETIYLWVACLMQLKNCHVHSFVAQEDDEAGWLAARTVGIGGSEIACIAGKSPWNSPRDIWFKKTGQFDESANKQSESARWGNVLETPILDEWAKRTGKQYVHIPVSIQADDNSILVANIDGFVVHFEPYDITTRESVVYNGVLYGKVVLDEILECKTTSVYNKEAWEEGPIPEYYLCQVNWYAGITGMTRYTIVCLVGGQQLFYYSMPINTSLYKELVDAANNFWNNYVLTLTAPELEAGDAEGMAEKMPEEPEEEAKILVDDESERLVDSYVKIRDQISMLENVKKALYARIWELFGTSHELITQTRVATVKVQYRKNCDTALLAKKFPLAFEECVTTKPSKSINIK